MRTLILASLTALVVCAACASPVTGDPAASPVPTEVGSTAVQPTTGVPSAGIEVGVAWQRTIGAPELKKPKVRLSPKELDFAPDGTLLVVLKFGDGTWTQFANYHGDALQPGAAGTYRYDDAGQLLLTDDAAGDTYRYAWEVSADALTLRMLDPVGRTPDDLDVVRLMTEGSYQRMPS